MRLINAISLKNKAFFIHTGGGVEAVVRYKDIINTPTENVAPVRRGRWVNIQNGNGCCSECHRLDAIDPIATHCRYCGARMDGDTNG